MTFGTPHPSAIKPENTLYLSYMKTTYLSVALFALPFLAAAQGPLTPSFQNFFTNLLIFIQSTAIPFLLGIGFLFIAINIVRYFIIGGSSEEGRDKAKSLAIYGVAAFVFLMVFWGIVNMISSSLGLANCPPVMWDYYAPGRGPVNQGAPSPAAPCPSSSTNTNSTSDAPASGTDGGLPFNALP